MNSSNFLLQSDPSLINRRFYRTSLPWPRRRPRTQAQRWFSSVLDRVQRELESGYPSLLAPGLCEHTPLEIARAFTATGESVSGEDPINVLLLAENEVDALKELAHRLMMLVGHTSALSTSVEFCIRALDVHSARVLDIRDRQNPITLMAGARRQLAQDAKSLNCDCAYFSCDLDRAPTDLLALLDLSAVAHFGEPQYGTMYYSAEEGGFSKWHWDSEMRGL